MVPLRVAIINLYDRLAIDLKCDWFLDRAIFFVMHFPRYPGPPRRHRVPRGTRLRQHCTSVPPLAPADRLGRAPEKGGGLEARPVGGVGPRRVEVTVRGTPGGTIIMCFFFPAPRSGRLGGQQAML